MADFASLMMTAKTIPFDATGTSGTLQAAITGKRFVVFHLYVSSDVTTDLLFNSGSTALTGAMTCNTILDLKNSGVPVLLGDAANESLNFTSSVGAAVLDGFAVIAMMEAQVAPF